MNTVTPKKLFDKQMWKCLHVVALVDPDEDLLPTRARYGSRPVFNVGVNYRSGEPQYWTLPDVIASKIATGKTPRILTAYRFEPRGLQDSLSPICIAGSGSSYTIDPRKEDLIRRLVELRADLKVQARSESGSSDIITANAQAVKTAANSIAYGSPIEMNTVEHSKRPELQVWLPDGTAFDVRPSRTERTGQWFNPLIATLVSSGGRLLLAMAMGLVERLGGNYVMCDTDSLFVVSTQAGSDLECPGGGTRKSGVEMIRALSWKDVNHVVKRFGALNPYLGPLRGRSILELEDVNLDPVTKVRREIICISIASKRYALFTWKPDGRPNLVARKEHGLGHLMSPSPKHEEGRTHWIDEWWEHAICTLLDISSEPPAWFERPAVGRMSVTSPREESAFGSFNDGLDYLDRVRPGNFIIVTRAHRLQEGPSLLVAPFQQTPDRWVEMEWFDRGQQDGPGYRIRVEDPASAIDGEVAVQSFRDYFEEFLLHPESKAAGADGMTCHTWTRGVLEYRRVDAIEIERIGKESNRLSEHPDTDRSIDYGKARDCLTCGQRMKGTRSKYCSGACKQKAYRDRQRRS